MAWIKTVLVVIGLIAVWVAGVFILLRQDSLCRYV